MNKTIEQRQLGLLNERQFMSKKINENLMLMVPHDEIIEPMEELIQVVELSNDNELLLASTVEEFLILDSKTFIPQFNKLACLGHGSLKSDNSPLPIFHVSLFWNQYDKSMFTKSGGTGTLEIWDVNSLNEPRDTSPTYEERDHKVYSTHSMDSENICVIAALDNTKGTVDILDLRIGLDVPLMNICDNRLAQRKFFNLAFNPGASQRLTTVGCIQRWDKQVHAFQLNEYDTRSCRKPLFSYQIGDNDRELNRFVPTIQFSGNAEKMYTSLAGMLYCFKTVDGTIVNKVPVREDDLSNLRISYGTTPEYLFAPSFRDIKVYDGNTLLLVSSYSTPPSVLGHRGCYFNALALDVSRQIMYTGHNNDLCVYTPDYPEA